MFYFYHNRIRKLTKLSRQYTQLHLKITKLHITRTLLNSDWSSLILGVYSHLPKQPIRAAVQVPSCDSKRTLPLSWTWLRHKPKGRRGKCILITDSRCISVGLSGRPSAHRAPYPALALQAGGSSGTVACSFQCRRHKNCLCGWVKWHQADARQGGLAEGVAMGRQWRGGVKGHLELLQCLGTLWTVGSVSKKLETERQKQSEEAPENGR